MTMTPYLDFLASALPPGESYDKFREAFKKTSKKEEVVVLINALSKTQFERLQKLTEESTWSEPYKDFFTVDTLMSCFYEDESMVPRQDIDYILSVFLKQEKYSRSCLLILKIIQSWELPDYNPVNNVLWTLGNQAKNNYRLTIILLFNCHLFTSTRYGNEFLFRCYDALMTVKEGRSNLLKKYVSQTNDQSKLLFMLVLNYHEYCDILKAQFYLNQMPETTKEEIDRKNDLERLVNTPFPKAKTIDFWLACKDPKCTFRLSDTHEIILSSD